MNFRYEIKKYNQGFAHIIGCDEVGRGCLAGPVVAGAVVFDRLKIKDQGLKIAEIKDSKLLTAGKREELSKNIKQYALAWGIGVVDEKVIDKINIHRATLLAMKRAVEMLMSANSCELALADVVQATRSGSRTAGLPQSKKQANGLHYKDSYLLAIDGKFTIPDLNIKQEAIVDGDNKILSIAAASIIAKVYRDDLMRELHLKYPIYNFAQHKGYGTLFHRTIILKQGLSPIHRRSFCKNLTPI